MVCEGWRAEPAWPGVAEQKFERVHAFVRMSACMKVCELVKLRKRAVGRAGVRLVESGGWSLSSRALRGKGAGGSRRARAGVRA